MFTVYYYYCYYYYIYYYYDCYYYIYIQLYTPTHNYSVSKFHNVTTGLGAQGGLGEGA